MTGNSHKHMISREITAFLIDRQARKLSQNTINYYEQELEVFRRDMARRNVQFMEDVTTEHLRLCLLLLGQRRSAGGVHACWRALKVFFRWWVVEVEYSGRNPMAKVQPPKRNTEPIAGVEPNTLRRLLIACSATRDRQRNRALLACLYDSGLRVSELIALKIEDVDLKTGVVTVRHGKGNKPRSVFLGATARRELVRYLRGRGEVQDNEPLFLSSHRRAYSRRGIDSLLLRLCDLAGIENVSSHDFRRGFTLQSLRNKADVLSIARQLGHSSTTLVARYARQTDDDLRQVHEDSSPVDNL